MLTKLFALLLIQLFQTEQCEVCPSPAMWQIVAKETCRNISRYHCVLDSTTHEYKHKCLQPVEGPAGMSIFLANPYLSFDSCRNDRYQPRKFWSYEHNRCVYKKSLCSEEGQLIYSNGTSIVDRLCHCDYTKGYVFAKPPRHQCYCVPSREDCGCILKQCSNTRYVLSPDYQCVLKDLSSSSKCRLITPSSVSYNKRKTNLRRIVGYDDTNYNIQFTGASKMLPTILIGITIFLGMMSIGIILRRNTYQKTDTYLELQHLKDCSERIFSKTMKDEYGWNTTNVFEKSRKALHNNSIVILKGRKGTGKKTLAMHLASGYINRQYKLAILDRQNAYMLTSLQNSDDKYIIILEEWFDAHWTETNEQPTHSHSINTIDLKNEVKIIITVTKLETNDIEKMSLTGVVCEDTLTNLDEGSAFPDEFKKSVLSFHMTKYARELSEKEIERIVSTETYDGFPLECLLFCCISMNFILGSKYYRQPSVALMDEINALRNSAPENERNRNMYSVMVYMLLNHENGLNINDIEIQEIEKIASQFIMGKGVSIPKPNISGAWREMAVKYLQSNENKNEYFLHPVVYQAVLISYAEYSTLCCKVVLEKCNLLQLLDVVRPSTYKKREGEMLLSIDFNQLLSGNESLSPRMADACLSDKTTMHLIVQYIKRYHSPQLLRNLMNHLETKIKVSLTEQRVENIMNIFEEIMCDDNSNDKHLGLLEYVPIKFALTWAIIVLQKSKSYEILETLVDRFLKRSNRCLVVDILRTVVDEHNNSVFHYCILWWENKDNPFIRFLSIDIRDNFKMWISYTKKILSIRNTKKMSALDFAALFWNHEVAKLFVCMKIELSKKKLLSASKRVKINKEIDTLLQYAGHGDVNNHIQNCTSCSWINMNVCGNICRNDTFDFDQTLRVLKELQNSNTV